MSAASVPPGRFLRLREVETSVGLRKTAIYRYMGDDRFPKPVEIGPGCVRWLEGEVEAWKAARIAAAREISL